MDNSRISAWIRRREGDFDMVEMESWLCTTAVVGVIDVDYEMRLSQLQFGWVHLRRREHRTPEKVLLFDPPMSCFRFVPIYKIRYT